MATKISDTEMTSDRTRHTARVVPGAVVEGGPTAWEVSWLPGRLLLRNQAITAMTIAEVVWTHQFETPGSKDPIWLHLDGWAAELGITGPNAVAEASLPPEDHEIPRGEWPSAGAEAVAAARTRVAADAIEQIARITGDDGDDQGDALRPGARVLLSVAGQLQEAYQVGLSCGRATAPATYPGMIQALSAVVLDGAEQLARIRAVLDAFDWETGDRQYALEAIDAIVSEDDAQGDDDEPDRREPCCTSCGADVGVFWGHGDGWHHWRPAEGGRTEIFDAGHAPVIGWREAASAAGTMLRPAAEFAKDGS
jgi:hypothetical protein